MRQPFKTEFKTEEFSIAVKYRRLLGPHETVGLGSNRERLDIGKLLASFDTGKADLCQWEHMRLDGCL
jgi:hypothetical protein